MTNSTSFLFLSILLTPSFVDAAEWGTLKGQFLYGGPGTSPPPAVRLKANPKMNICGNQPLFNESLIVSSKNRGIQNIIIYAYKPGRVHPKYAQQQAPVIADNKNCRFEPHVTLVPTTRILRVKNSDPFAHNYFVQFLKNRPQNPLVASGQFVDIQLSKSELLPISVTCGVHPWMRGIVLVQDHPYMAATDADGKFELQLLPSENLTLRVWHEKAGWIKEVSIDGKRTNWHKGRYPIKLDKTQNHVYEVPPQLFDKN